MNHSAIRQQFYDFLHNELDEIQYRAVEQHVASCRRCAEALDDLRRTLALLPRPGVEPADDRDEAFWQSLAIDVEREIRLRWPSRQSLFTTVVDRFRSFVALRPAYVYSAGAALATILVAAFIFRPQPDPPGHVAGSELPADSMQVMTAADESQQRIGDYFRKSKTLLVGIANMRTDIETGIDLSAEQRLSRSLVHEARYLQQHQLDERSARLVRDLEKIMIELANMEETNDLPNVELIRSGIRQENLLFKIRMAAASYNPPNSHERIY